MKKRSSVIFREYVARSKKSREAALLCYRGLGAAVKMSAILFDDKNLELLGCLSCHAIWQCLRSQDKQPTKNYTAILARTWRHLFCTKMLLEVAYALKDLQEYQQ